MSLALGFASGLGQGLASLADENMRRDAELARDQRLNAFQKERDQTLSDLEMKKQQATEALRNAPILRLQAKAQELAGEQVPVEAQPVTELSGSGVNPKTGEPLKQGLIGNIRSLMAQAQALPDTNPDKAGIIAQIRSQLSDEQAKAQESVKGKTRARTSEEALESALDWAKSADLPAFMAGRGLVSEKTVTVPEGATIIDKKGKVIFDGTGSKTERENARQDRLDARQEKAEEARNARQERMLEARDELAKQRAGEGGATTREERIRYTSLFSEAGRRMADVQKTINALRSEPMYSMAKPGSKQAKELEDLQEQLKDYKKERDTYGALLSGSQTNSQSGKPVANDPLGLFTK